MKDFIPKGTGNSRWMKSSIPTGTTWEEALAMLRAGTFPFDLNGINSAGVAQMGDALNKANLLTDAVAAMFGLSSSAVPNDVLKKLANAAFISNGGIVDANGDSAFPRIEFGSYVGTSKYGSSNPNSLTFNSSVYLLSVFRYRVVSNGISSPVQFIISPYSSYGNVDHYLSAGSYYRNMDSIQWSDNNKKVAWYSDSDNDSQLNYNAYEYFYFVIRE